MNVQSIMHYRMDMADERCFITWCHIHYFTCLMTKKYRYKKPQQKINIFIQVCLGVGANLILNINYLTGVITIINDVHRQQHMWQSETFTVNICSD